MLKLFLTMDSQFQHQSNLRYVYVSVTLTNNIKSKMIGEQSFTFNYSRDAFLKEIAAARTFVEKV